MTAASAGRYFATCAILAGALTTAAPAIAQTPSAGDDGGFDLFSPRAFTVLTDIRLAAANGGKSFVDGGFGKTRFQGKAGDDFNPIIAPIEADIVWNPRFTSALSANVSVALQRDHDGVDIMEAFVTYLPSQGGPVRLSGRAGLMWPEISLEHSTGGAWTTVNTITPSAINSWVGEEVKVLGVETTLRASLGENDFGLTGGIFGGNDTSGTLLSFRGWALHDVKATASGSFPLPPLNTFIGRIQENKTDNSIEIDHRPGFYGRLDWQPPIPVSVAAFYYDNEGDPESETRSQQWGWRTRFWNLGISADVAPGTKILAQAMTGSTLMGFVRNGRNWVDTDFQSAFVLGVHDFGRLALSGRIEDFKTREHGSQMSVLNSEDGLAMTAAVRAPINDQFTAFAEVLNVRNRKGTRITQGGLPSDSEHQTVVQLALRGRF